MRPGGSRRRVSASAEEGCELVTPILTVLVHWSDLVSTACSTVGMLAQVLKHRACLCACARVLTIFTW